MNNTIPSVSVNYAANGSSTKSNELGMRPMQERAYDKRGEQYLLIKSPPASGKSRALMFVALDKLHNQGLRKAIIVVPEKSIGSKGGGGTNSIPSCAASCLASWTSRSFSCASMYSRKSLIKYSQIGADTRPPVSLMPILRFISAKPLHTPQTHSGV